MTGKDEQDRPGVEEIVAYLNRPLRQPRRRVARAQVGDYVVWIKRYDRGLPPLGKIIHEVISPVLWPRILKASRHRGASGLAIREARKIAAFHAAGINVPEVLYRKGGLIVLSHEGESLETLLSELRIRDPVAHDQLLLRTANLLARVHVAGLCHGRPHKRDIVVRGETWSFVDFEEEPEAVMPLRAAQARDVLLLFLRIAHSSLHADIPRRAFIRYRRAAPENTQEYLHQLVRVFRPLLPLLRVILRFRPGGDLESLRAVIELFDRELPISPANSTADASKNTVTVKPES